MKRALVGLPGVMAADVSLAEAKAQVTYRPAEVTIERMVEAIGQAGFTARPAAGA